MYKEIHPYFYDTFHNNDTTKRIHDNTCITYYLGNLNDGNRRDRHRAKRLQKSTCPVK